MNKPVYTLLTLAVLTISVSSSAATDSRELLSIKVDILKKQSTLKTQTNSALNISQNKENTLSKCIKNKLFY